MNYRHNKQQDDSKGVLKKKKTKARKTLQEATKYEGGKKGKTRTRKNIK